MSPTPSESESSVSVGSINEMVVLTTGSGNLDLMLFSGKEVWTVSISDQSINSLTYLESTSEILSNNAANVNTALHMEMDGRGPLLLIGTDGGLMAWNTTDGSDSVGTPWWVFNREDSENFVQ